MGKHCSGCGLPKALCFCSDIQPCTTNVKLVLLLHENEPQRASSTSKLISQVLADSEVFIWQRKAPPEKLISMLKDEQYQPWLLFPADRPELKGRANTYQNTDNKKNLIIVPDGTWKEVRKIVRKSPWLDSLPLLSFSPTQRTRYHLRRNPDAEHLCTAETVAQLLRLSNNLDAGQKLDDALDTFLERYQQWRQAGYQVISS